MKTLALRRFRPLLAAALVATGFLVPSTHTAAGGVDDITGSARGQAIEVSSAERQFAGRTVPASRLDLARSDTEVDSTGLGIGSDVAHGTGKPVQHVTGGVTTVLAADSEASAPPNSTDTDGVPDVVVPGVVDARTPTSGAKADATSGMAPHAEATASMAEVKALTSSTPPVVDASVIFGSAKSGRDAETGAAVSTAHAHVTKAMVVLAGQTIEVSVTEVSATASATGVAPPNPGASTASTSCTIAMLKVNGNSPLPLPTCDSAPIDVLGLVKIDFGNKETHADAKSASARVDAVTITTKLGQKVVLGAAEATASTTATPQDPCELEKLALASGSAQGDAVRVRVDEEPLDVQADVARSDARIDEAGLDDGGPHAAKADGAAGRVEDFNVPALVQIGDSHAAAPPDQSSSANVLAANIGSILKESTLASTAEAESNEDGTHPSASSSAAVSSVNVDLAPTLTADAATLTSDANSTRSGGTTTSSSHAGVENMTMEVAGIPVEVHLLNTSATASANGHPGGATTGTTYQFAYVQVGDLVFDHTNNPPAGTEIPVGGLLKLTFGKTTEAASDDGGTATATVDGLQIDILAIGEPGDPEVVISRSTATASMVTARATLVKDVDIHFLRQSYGDSGATAAPHQKLWYLICYQNTGSQDLTNVVITDVLDANLRVVELPSGVSLSGNTLKRSVGTLASGEGGSFEVLVEVKSSTPLGTLIKNTASLKADQLAAPVQSNEVVTNVGIHPDQPALSVKKLSTSWNPETRILTVKEQLVNHAGAGTSYDTRIEKITATKGVTVVSDLPEFGTVEPGGKRNWTLELLVPHGVTRFSIDIMETGWDGPEGDPDRELYAFD